MKNRNQWLHRTRVNVTALESRVTPGSLLLGGVDLSAFADLLPNPEPATGPAAYAAKLDMDEAPANTETQAIAQGKPATAPVAVQPASASTPTRFTGLLPAPAQVSHGIKAPVSHPAMYTPAASIEVAPQTSGARSTGTQSVTDEVRPDRVSIPANRISPVAAREFAIQQQTSSAAPAMEWQACETPEAGKAFTNSFATYTDRGSASDTEVLGVASGKGGNTNKVYAVGYRGTTAVVTRYNGLASSATIGACEFETTLAGGYKATGVAVNTQGVYVSFTKNDNSEAIVTRFAADLTAPISVTETAPAGGAVKYNAIAVSPNGSDPDVFIAGLINDPNAFAGNLGYAIRLEPNLTTSGQSYANGILLDFGATTDMEFNGVDADRPRNAYFGGRSTDAVGGDVSVIMKLDNLGAFAWGNGYVGSLSVPTFDTRIGMGGVRFLGGTTIAGGIYSTGAIGNDETLGLPPEALLQIETHLDPADGLVNATGQYEGGAYSGALGDLIATDVAVDRDGNAYQSAYRSADTSITLHDGRVYKVDLGQAVVDQQNFDSPTKDDGPNSVDLATTSPTAHMYYGGLTNSTPAELSVPIGPAASACDLTYNGVKDGFLAGSTQ